MSRRTADPAVRERRLAWTLLAPALAAILGLAIVPLGWTAWDSLHLHDLRMPWLGHPFIGLANYAEALGDPRFWAAMGHTVFFTGTSVALEMVLGLCLALAMDRALRLRGLVRVLVLLPWAIPTVVAALVWRFMFQGNGGVVDALIRRALPSAPVWFADAHAAWVPIILADVWKTTPFVALLLLAGLQSIDPKLIEAARIDGAGAWQRLRRIILPLLRPAIVVALVFRTLDAFRVFDLVYVLTGGGPGTATEPIALYTFDSLMQDLRFGYGSALSMIVFISAFLLAVVYIRALGRGLVGERT